MPEPLHGARVLVTGAGGFVGRHVTRALAGAGARVRAATGPPGCGLAADESADESVALDICDADAVRRAVTGCDLVVHLAGPSSVAESFTNAPSFARVHVQGTATVADAVRRAGAARIVYVSSAEVYGRPRADPVPEDHPLAARSPYGACKIAAEQLLGASAAAFGQDAVVLRPFSLYGPGASPHALVGRVVTLARSGEPMVLQDLRPVRDYCYVTDFADAIVAAATLPSGPALRVFNAGTGRGTSVAEVARLALDALGVDRPVTASGSARPGASDILRLVADTTRAGAELGWTPRVSMDVGLRLLLAERD